MSDSRKGTPPHVRCLLWGRAAGRCQFAGCNRDLTMDPNTKEAMSFRSLYHMKQMQDQTEKTLATERTCTGKIISGDLLDIELLDGRKAKCEGEKS